ncbi:MULTISPECIES: ABC transporter permease [Lactococcus]|uniref:ABC transporter permease n=1 Tax=Lactococcus TaxID=1357 RepID=UPI0020425DC4|nr:MULTISPECIES: ABC transporter permease [Lactococcus]
MNELRLLRITETFTIKRFIRDIKYVSFIIVLPVLFYVMFTAIFPKNAAVDGLSWNKYSLISMISFAIVGNAINLLGTRVAIERNDRWMDYIRVSPVSSLYYSISFAITFILISLLTIVILFVTAFVWQGVSLSLGEYIGTTVLLLIGSIPFVLIGLLIGHLGSAAQPVGMIFYLSLSFLGGLWMPVEAMPENIQSFARVLPTYSLANLGWEFLGKTSLEKSLVVLLFYLIITIVLLVIVRKKECSS